MPPAECARRLDQAKARSGLFGPSTDAPRGRVSDEGFALYYIPRGIRNSFVPLLDARFVGAGSTTIIEGRFRMPRFTQVFMAIWFGGILAFFVGALVVAIVHLAQGDGHLKDLGFAAFPLGMLAFGVALVAFGRYGLGSRSESTVVAFVERTCDAKIVDRPAASTGWRDRFSRRAEGPADAAIDFAELLRGFGWLKMLKSRSGAAVLVPTLAAEGVFIWMWFRAASGGCTGSHKFDPHYYCPGGSAVFMLWLLGAASIIGGLIGMYAWARRWRRVLAGVIVIQFTIIAIGISISSSQKLIPHSYPPGKTDSPNTP